MNSVIRELRAHGIAVTALHSHMLEETPRLFFMHFWGVDTPDKIDYERTARVVEGIEIVVRDLLNGD